MRRGPLAVRLDDGFGGNPPMEREMITLTVREIRDLAMFAGLMVKTEFDLGSDEIEAQVSITIDPTECTNDEGNVERYAHVAHMTEYPEEGCCPLGDPIAA
jgi:hypothetical protein